MFQIKYMGIVFIDLDSDNVEIEVVGQGKSKIGRFYVLDLVVICVWFKLLFYVKLVDFELNFW